MDLRRESITLAAGEGRIVFKRIGINPPDLDKQEEERLPTPTLLQSTSATSSIVARLFDRRFGLVPPHHSHSDEPTMTSTFPPDTAAAEKQHSTSCFVPAPYQDLEPWEYAGLKRHQHKEHDYARDNIRNHIHVQIDKMRRVLLQLNESHSTSTLDMRLSANTDDWLKNPSGSFDNYLQSEEHDTNTPTSTRGSLTHTADMCVGIGPVGRRSFTDIVPALGQGGLNQQFRESPHRSTVDKSARVDSPLRNLDSVHYNGYDESKDSGVMSTEQKASCLGEHSTSTERQIPPVPPRNSLRPTRSINALENHPAFSPSPAFDDISQVGPSALTASLPIRPTIALHPLWDRSRSGSRFFEDFSSDETPLPSRPVRTDLAAQRLKTKTTVAVPLDNASRSRQGPDWSWRKRSPRAQRSVVPIQHMFRNIRADENENEHNERPVSGRTLQEIAAAPFEVGSNLYVMRQDPFVLDDVEGCRAENGHSRSPNQVCRWVQPLVLSAMFLVFVIVGLWKLARWRTGILEREGSSSGVAGLQMPTVGEALVFFMAIVGVYVAVSEALRWALLSTQKNWKGCTSSITTLRAPRLWMKWLNGGENTLAVILGAVMASTFVAGILWGVLRV
jgi:hypothetical protein